MTTEQVHLTDYERAVFYYTLPRMRTPFPTGVTILYAIAMLLAVATIVYGAATGNSEWLRAGAIGFAFGAIVGIGSFMLRDFMNQIKERSALASAKGVPDADSQFDDIPDPFGDHVLLCYPIRHAGNSLQLKNNKGVTQYVAELDAGAKTLTVSDAEDKTQFVATLDSTAQSFSFETGSPAHVMVEADGEKVADVHRNSNFGPANVEIECFGENPAEYQYSSGGLFQGEELVGRIYEVHQQHYLDVKKAHLSYGVLSFFVTIG